MDDERRPSARTSLRADARRNEGRVLNGAREAFAKHGFAASYHDIARAAGVGVGTVYRRFPDRDALVEAVLLGVLSGLTEEAGSATADVDAWVAFERFFRALADRMHHHAGLSSQAGVQASVKVEEARGELLDAVGQLCQRAAPYLRAGIGWQDVVFLAQITSANGCSLGVEATEERRQRAISTTLNGMRRNTDSG